MADLKNIILNFGGEIKKQIDKFDIFVKKYNAVSQTSQIPTTAYMNWGIELAQRGKIDEAIDKLRTASLMAGKNPGVYINLGITFLRQKNYEEAIKNFRQAIHVDKYNSKAYALWASALSEIGDLKGAIDIYKLAQKYDSRDPDIYLNWGISLAKAGKKKEAREKFKKSVSLNPINPVTSFLWGLVLYEEGEYQEAISKFSHSSIYSQDKYDSTYYIALCHLKLNNYKSAIKYAQEALKINNTCSDAYIILADAYLKTCEEEKCLQAFIDANEKAQVSTQFFINWGLALQHYHYIDTAREKLNYALTLEPNNTVIIFNLGVNYLLSKEYTQAEEFFLKVLEIMPEHAQALFNLGALAFDKGDCRQALEYYKKSLQLDKKNTRIYYNMANCYYKLDELDEAARYFKKCIEYCPDLTQAYISYAHLLAETGEDIEAQRKARSAYLMDKDSCYTNFAVGAVYLKLKKFDDALERFENAIKINPDYHIASLGIAEVHCRRGEYEKAFLVLDSLSDEVFDKNETLNILYMILNTVSEDSNASQSVVNSALQYCNKFLELYNNDKIQEIQNTLVNKKNQFEADK